MNIRKTGKLLALVGATAALVASLVNDKKDKSKAEENQK